jgi:Anthrax toxin lethal factor, N- and C-terminal domain
MSGPAHVALLMSPTWIVAAVKGVLARDLTSTGGSGTAADARLVRTELERMPVGALQIMTNNKTKVIACRDNITDYRTDLKGVQPRGWDPGDTWDIVPGVFSGDKNEVVIATIGHGTAAGAHVPATGEGHGSSNLTIHESFHAVDLGAGGTSRSSEADFVTARTADLATLDTYEGQAGTAGQEETYAESAARYYSGDATDAATHPNLHDFWDKHPPTP